MHGIHRVPLWQTDTPTPMQEVAPETVLTDILEPELHVFPAVPEKNSGLAAIICPGGGYGVLALGAEGHSCAAFLASVGITGMVLQYRFPHGNKTIPLEDIATAMLYARTHAAVWNYNPNTIGVIGFSAGGHLAGMVSTVSSEAQPNTRPDFSVLFYPVISMEKRKRGLTRVNLLGRHASEQETAEYSCHTRVTAKTPPALLLHCDDDPLVPPRHSMLYYAALKQHNIPASLHIFPEGGHAWGFRGVNLAGQPFRYTQEVRSLMIDWIFSRKS